MLKLSVRSVDWPRKRGQLAAVKVMSTVRFRPEDVDAYLDVQRKANADRPS